MDRTRIGLLAALLWYCASGVAEGGLPHWRRRAPAPYPSDVYAPQMRHYTVIDPAVVSAPPPSKHSLLSKTPAAGQVLWRQQVEAVPAYPWGWFGARRQTHNSQHTRFYGEARDWALLRGD